MNGFYGGENAGFQPNFPSSSTFQPPHPGYSNDPQLMGQQGHWSQQQVPVQPNQHLNYPQDAMVPSNLYTGYPPQVINEAWVFSLPVKPEDEPLLVDTLVLYHNSSLSYKDALDSLHGANRHSRNLWKDYYLDHKYRIDQQISARLSSMQQQQGLPVKTAKKPSPNFFKADSATPPPKRKAQTPNHASSSPPAVSTARRKTVNSPAAPEPDRSLPVHNVDIISTSRRKTMNSLTGPEPVFDRSLPAPNADIKVPSPPSRSPSPPTGVIPRAGGRGNKYTAEDRKFFLEFLSWRLKNDPTLTRTQLCDLLAEKAPHHAATSWYSYWSNNHDLPDKILAAAHGEEKGEDNGNDEFVYVSEPEDRRVVRRPRRYTESSSESREDSEEELEVSLDEDVEIPPFDESAMGAKGEPFTEADLGVVIRHMASFTNFKHATFQEKWVTFAQKYPQRSAKAWAEYYRRNEARINLIACKFKADNSMVGSRLKRKREGAEDYPWNHKQARHNL